MNNGCEDELPNELYLLEINTLFVEDFIFDQNMRPHGECGFQFHWPNIIVSNHMR